MLRTNEMIEITTVINDLRLETAILDVLLLVVVTQLDKTDETDDLSGSPGRDGVKSRKPGLHGRVRNAKSDVTRAAVARSSHHVADHSEHGDAAMLDLSVAELVEFLLWSVLEETQRIPEAKRGDDSRRALVAHLQHGSRGWASGREGTGGQQGGEDGGEAKHG